MSEEPEGSLVSEAAQAIAAIVEKVPIYQDAVQPAAREVGRGLQVVARAVNAALAPVEGLIWGVEKIRDFVREKISAKLENVPAEDIQPPKPHVGVPTIDALRYTGSEPALSEMYANLLAISMDKKTAHQAHPAFVDIIKNMSPDEARIMRFLASRPNNAIINVKLVKPDGGFNIVQRRLSLIGLDAGCEHAQLAQNYLDNLCRLGLVEIPEGRFIRSEDLYKRIEELPEITNYLNQLRAIEGHKVKIEKRKLGITDLGNQFIQACVVDKSVQARGG